MTLQIRLADGSCSTGQLELWEQSPDNPDMVRLAFACLGQSPVLRDAENFFRALCAIRVCLEKMGILIVCYGASRNVYPSGMIESMGNAEKAYRLKLGCPGKLVDLVSIFDVGPDVEPVAVSEQEAFFAAWCKSLR